MSIIDGIKIINGVVNGIDVANSLFEFGKNIKGEDYLKLHYNLVYTGGTMWTKLGEYNETNEISLFRRESEKDDFLSYPMGDLKCLKVFTEGFHEPYHLRYDGSLKGQDPLHPSW